MATLVRQSSVGLEEPASRELIEYHSDSLSNRNRRNIFKEICKSLPKLGLIRNTEDLTRLLTIFKNNGDIDSYISDVMVKSADKSSSELIAPLNFEIKRIKSDMTEEKLDIVITKDFRTGLEKNLMQGYYYSEGIPNDILLIIHKNKILGRPINRREIFKEIFINSVLSLFESKYLRKDKDVPEGVANLIMNTYFKIDGEIHLVSIINKFDGGLDEYLRIQQDNCTCSLNDLVKDVLFQVSCSYDLLHQVFYFQHNDLHLGNIFYKNKGNQNISYLLGDFGLSSIRIFVDADILPDHNPSESIFIAKDTDLNSELIKHQKEFEYCIDYDFYKLALFLNNKLQENDINVNEILFNNTTDEILSKIKSRNRRDFPKMFSSYRNFDIITLFLRIGVIEQLYLDLKDKNYNFIHNIKTYLERTGYEFKCSNLHKHIYNYTHGRIPLEHEYDGDDEFGDLLEEPIPVDFDKKYYKKYLKYKSKYINLRSKLIN